jgi:LmbE family N-acetylglucosaminyl deacetylase
MTGPVVVSPHLDDAAFSASALLGRGGATVVTVFTAVPDADWPTTWWDTLTGATSSQSRQLERRAEDEAAMRLLGAEPVYLEETEFTYRSSPPDLSSATRRLADCFSGAAQIWLPAAIGGHPDHLAARDMGLRAAALAGRADVTLYADFPYILSYGWPPSLTGRPGRPYVDADFWLADQLRQAGLRPAYLHPELVALDPAQRARKQEVLSAYRSQAQVLALGPADLEAAPEKLEFEVSWRMPLVADPGLPPAAGRIALMSFMVPAPVFTPGA